MSDKNENVEEMAVWEVIYTPYPSELKKVSLERMVDLIAIALYDKKTLHKDLTNYYGDIGLSAEAATNTMTFSASERTASRFGHKIGKFQDDLAAFLGYEGYQGNLSAQRVIQLNEPGLA